MNFLVGLGKDFTNNGVAIMLSDFAIWGFSIRSSIVKLNLCPLQILSIFSIALIDLGSPLLETNNINVSSIILLNKTIEDNIKFIGLNKIKKIGL